MEPVTLTAVATAMLPERGAQRAIAILAAADKDPEIAQRVKEVALYTVFCRYSCYK
ncbi:hypothetical protein [Brasilonema octagenarum]|uniref:hypothetical protein n=1 Tax=Brasilonema octagenarum TaxID=417105 RepID=UPI00145D3C27|nr:hypothetical protein [Brasilonema octagenarum]